MTAYHCIAVVHEIQVAAKGEHFVVKFGLGVDLIEGEKMLYVRQQTQIPVPRVYALYSRGQTNHIVMEKIAGQTLSSAWLVLNDFDKQTITGVLSDHFKELRDLPLPNTTEAWVVEPY